VRSRLPSWEAQLWSYLSSGDGMHCPLANTCDNSTDSERCTDINQGNLTRLIAADGEWLTDAQRGPRPCRRGVMPLIERLAEEQLRKGGVQGLPVPNSLLSLADENRSIEVRRVNLKACCAATWLVRDGWVIQLSDNGSPSHSRMCLFHEAFHILAHSRSKAQPVFSRRGIVQGHFNELMADYFAMCILMPREWVRAKWAEGGDASTLSEVFGVPGSAMWLRLHEFDLVD